MSKVGPIWRFFVLCLLASTDTIPKPQLLLLPGDIQKPKIASFYFCSVLFRTIKQEKYILAKKDRVYPPLVDPSP